MSRIQSTPTQITVFPPWAPPYAVPSAGGKRELVATGTGRFLLDVMPAWHTATSWRYSVLTSYGGGAFTPELTQGGAYVGTNHGGHGAPQTPGFVAFDFTTGLWAPYVHSKDASGVDFVQQTTDFTLAELKDDPVYGRDDMEVAGYEEHPAPDHTYQLLHVPPRAKTGGVLRLVRTATTAASQSAWSGSRAHQLALEGPNLARWSRASSNRFREFFSESTLTETESAYDPTDNRLYYPLRYPYEGRMPYLDLNDATWKSLSYQTAFGSDPGQRSTFVDAARRLLVLISAGAIHFVRLDEATPVMRQATFTGTAPNAGGFKSRCTQYPVADGGDDRWYTFWGRGLRTNHQDGAVKEKAADPNVYGLEIPADPIAGTWLWSSLNPVDQDSTGALSAAVEADFANAGGIHYTRFFYVLALRCFAWIPRHDSNVELFKP